MPGVHVNRNNDGTFSVYRLVPLDVPNVTIEQLPGVLAMLAMSGETAGAATALSSGGNGSALVTPPSTTTPAAAATQSAPERDPRQVEIEGLFGEGGLITYSQIRNTDPRVMAVCFAKDGGGSGKRWSKAAAKKWVEGAFTKNRAGRKKTGYTAPYRIVQPRPDEIPDKKFESYWYFSVVSWSKFDRKTASDLDLKDSEGRPTGVKLLLGDRIEKKYKVLPPVTNGHSANVVR